jgi:hypothetical protein
MPNRDRQARPCWGSSPGGPPLGRWGESKGIAKRDLQDVLPGWQRELKGLKAQTRHELLALKQNWEAMLKQGNAPEKAKALGGIIDKNLDNPNWSPVYLFSRLSQDEMGPAMKRSQELYESIAKAEKGIGACNDLLSNHLAEGRDNHKIKQEAHLLSRAVASYHVDLLLGTNVLSEEKFGVDSQGLPIGISVQVDGVAMMDELPNGKMLMLKVDYTSHQVQKGLYDLEVVDYLTGQIDRHTGNIFIDPETGKVKGIDNDLAFPQVDRDSLARGGGLKAKMVGRLPSFMHEETANNLKNLTEDELRRTLEAVKYPGRGNVGLTKKEIDGAVERLKELQAHVDVLRANGRIVKTFDKQTYDTAVKEQLDDLVKHSAQTDPKRGKKVDYESDLSLNDLNNGQLTSYVGAVEVARRRTEQAIKLGKGEFIDLAKLKAGNIAYKTDTDGGQHAKQELQQRIDYCQSRIDALNKKSFGAVIKSLHYGGIEEARAAFKNKLDEAQKELNEVKAYYAQPPPGILNQASQAKVDDSSKGSVTVKQTDIKQTPKVSDIQDKVESRQTTLEALKEHTRSKDKQLGSTEPDSQGQDLDKFDVSKLPSLPPIPDPLPEQKPRVFTLEALQAEKTGDRRLKQDAEENTLSEKTRTTVRQSTGLNQKKNETQGKSIAPKW